MNNAKNLVLMTSVFAGSLFVASCNNTPVEQREAMNDKMEKIEEKAVDARGTLDWQSEKNEIIEDLRDLWTNIDNKLTNVNDDLANTDLKASVRAEKEAMKVELLAEKAKIEGKIKNVEAATADTWDMTKSDAENTANDVKSWWEKQKEKVDLKTDADKDMDGH